MTKKETQVFEEESRNGYLVIALAFVAVFHIFNGWNQINSQVAITGDALAATVPARPTDDLMQ